jgi:hypothetical protein
MSEKILKATHEADLRIGNIIIPAAVLEDRTRVLSRIGFIKAIGRTGKAKGGRQYDEEFKTPVFLTASNLKPFIPKELDGNSTPIAFKTSSGNQALGYKAELLPLVCGVFLDAKNAGVLLPNQEHIAEKCRILLRGFAQVGIIALIDEATGYQEIRDRRALEQILDKYLLKEHAKWAKRFPDEFYQQIFRLRGWPWRGMKVNRPSAVASYTTDFVYARLAPGVLAELERLNPIDAGRRAFKHHQWLTLDIGHPALQAHLSGIMAIMRGSTTWEHARRMIQRAYPKINTTLEIPFPDDDQSE